MSGKQEEEEKVVVVFDTTACFKTDCLTEKGTSF
jgi:hypothetical protein